MFTLTCITQINMVYMAYISRSEVCCLFVWSSTYIYMLRDTLHIVLRQLKFAKVSKIVYGVKKSYLLNKYFWSVVLTPKTCLKWYQLRFLLIFYFSKVYENYWKTGKTLDNLCMGSDKNICKMNIFVRFFYS